MANDIDDRVPEQVRLIRRSQDEMRLEFGDVINALEASFDRVTTQLGNVQTQIAIRNGRLDRIGEGLTPIERRLDLIEA